MILTKPRVPEFQFSGYRDFGNLFIAAVMIFCASAIHEIGISGELDFAF